MKLNPCVSIIVPVYNAQDYLERCLDSICGQEYQDYELLLVDDGSTDSSGRICDSYAKRDERIHVIHKENTGVSDSRNRALCEARGTYLQFLDSDDWITPDSTKLLVRSMVEYKCDMVIADFYRVSGERLAHKGDIEDDGILTRQEFAAHMIENPADFYYGVLWNKMYKREIVEKYHIRMDCSISWCEDFLFNLEYIRHAQTFYALQAPIYYYLKRKGSLVSQGMSINNTLRMKINVFEYYNEFYKDVYDEDDYEEIRLQVYRFLVSAARDGNVFPVPLTGSKKLGEEKNPIHKGIICGDGIAMDSYRFRKLLECQLSAVAKKNNLTMDEVMLLFCLVQSSELTSSKELADFSGMTPRRVSALLQKLEKRKLLEKEQIDRKTSRFILHLEETSLPKDLQNAQEDFKSVCFAGFSQKEREVFEAYSDRVKGNIVELLEKH